MLLHKVVTILVWINQDLLKNAHISSTLSFGSWYTWCARLCECVPFFFRRILLPKNCPSCNNVRCKISIIRIKNNRRRKNYMPMYNGENRARVFSCIFGCANGLGRWEQKKKMRRKRCSRSVVVAFWVRDMKWLLADNVK